MQISLRVPAPPRVIQRSNPAGAVLERVLTALRRSTLSRTAPGGLGC